MNRTLKRLAALALATITPAVQAYVITPLSVAHGGTGIEEPPGLREGAMGAMHLSYVRDPDGNKLCAIWRVPKA